MQVDIEKYTQRVIDSYTKIHHNELAVSLAKLERFRNIILQMGNLIDGHSIKECEVDIINGETPTIQITIDIGYFEEEVCDSCFLWLLRECQQFEIHPGALSKILFQFEGVWENK